MPTLPHVQDEEKIPWWRPWHGTLDEADRCIKMVYKSLKNKREKAAKAARDKAAATAAPAARGQKRAQPDAPEQEVHRTTGGYPRKKRVSSNK